MSNPLLIALVIVLVILAVGGSPFFGYHSYGWGPSGGLGLLVLILVILLLLGKL